MNPPDPAPGSLPDVLQARLRLGLYNWVKRTLLWGSLLVIFSVKVPILKVVLIGWIVFSAVSLALLLLGMKLAKNLQGGSVSFGTGTGRGPVFNGNSTSQDIPPPPRAPDGPSEIIEIETEVLPPETPPARRVLHAREAEDA